MEHQIAILNFEDLIAHLNTDLRIKDYIVFDMDRSNLLIKLNLWYKANYSGIVLVTAGSGRFTVDDQSFEVKANDVIYTVLRESFTIDYISPDYKAKEIFFSNEFINEAGFNYKSNDMLRRLTDHPSGVIAQQSGLFRRLMFHMEELEALNRPDAENYYFNEMIWHHFSLLMYEIDNHFKRNETVRLLTSREEEITTDFFALVRTHFVAHHDIQFYADELCISRKYLSRVIRRTMSKTPSDIINQILTIEAKLLLRNTSNNVCQVAEQLNFSDQAVFSKFFKKHTGTNPSDYKRDDLF
ncbi:AraC family transcriptional regulator [Sphingobacterium sp. SYP-B4668]|uniref:AraC family transcriptional regulator n=1 Tax=Sphingobacterium sp. SYP-B4668 TaxID=2996035 RepID=UPI0022DD5697|nr:AraC family transcriptional regulator [Sphingobacterium sp. SYP-B4668]